MTSQKVVLVVEGMPDKASATLLTRELVGLPRVIAATSQSLATAQAYALQLAGSGSPGDLVATDVLRPLNAQLGQACFVLGTVSQEQVAVALDPRCAAAPIISRLETNPPAGLYGAPPGRQRTVIKNPETLRKLAV